MDYTAIGDTTNLAARLQSLAEPGTILISDATQRLVRGFFDLRATRSARGEGQARARRRLRGARARRRRPARCAVAESRGLTPLVGRDEELAQLDGLLRAPRRRPAAGRRRRRRRRQRQVAAHLRAQAAARRRQPVEFLEARCSVAEPDACRTRRGSRCCGSTSGVDRRRATTQALRQDRRRELGAIDPDLDGTHPTSARHVRVSARAAATTPSRRRARQARDLRRGRARLIGASAQRARS